VTVFFEGKELGAMNVKEAREQALDAVEGALTFKQSVALRTALDALVAAAKAEERADLWIVNSPRPMVDVTNLPPRERVERINRNAPCDVQDGLYVTMNIAGARLENATCGETATLIISVPVNGGKK
jgi:hypothetical protein